MSYWIGCTLTHEPAESRDIRRRDDSYFESNRWCFCPPNRRNRLDQMLSKSVPSADDGSFPSPPPPRLFVSRYTTMHRHFLSLPSPLLWRLSPSKHIQTYPILLSKLKCVSTRPFQDFSRTREWRNLINFYIGSFVSELAWNLHKMKKSRFPTILKHFKLIRKIIDELVVINIISIQGVPF